MRNFTGATALATLIFGLVFAGGCVGSDRGVKYLPPPLWMDECRNAPEKCAAYIVNPFLIDERLTGVGHWPGLGGYTVVDPLTVRSPQVGNMDVPLRGKFFLSTGGYYPVFGITGYATINAESIAPRDSFREVSGCWPIEQITLEDSAADTGYTVIFTEGGKATAWDGQKTRTGKVYVFGQLLFHLRYEVDEVLSERDLSDERFFVFMKEGYSNSFESTTIDNHVTELKVRAFPEGECKLIKSEAPKLASWDVVSKKKIRYPPKK